MASSEAEATQPRRRGSFIPDVPTIDKSGVPEYAEAGSDLWWGVVGPGGLPGPVLDKLNDNIVRVMRSPAMAERIKAQYLDSLLSTPEEFRKMLATDFGK